MDHIDSSEAQFDLLIKGGTIIDGTGGSAYQGDIGIKKERISQLGPISDGGAAKTIIDATGKIVCPGFIDMHTHVDVESNGSDLFSDPYAENFIMQGTTTVFGGNCGLGANLISDFLNKIKPIFNVGLLLGHGGLRESVMGMDNRAPSVDELERMKDLVREGMEEGAFGLSSGLGYSPGSYADLSEIVELCKVVAQAGGIYTSHIREQANKINESWDEIVQTGLLSKVRVHIAHVQVIGQKNWGASQGLVKRLNTARRSGVLISCDGYPYESGGTTIVGALIPNWVQAEGNMKNRLKEKALLPGIKKEIEELLDLRGGSKSVLITSCPGNPKIEKKYLKDIATTWNLDPVDAVIKIAQQFPDCWAIYFHSTERDKEVFFQDPYCAVGSDSFCVLSDKLDGRLVHPRSYGTMPGFICEYVKKKQIVSLEEGIRKMTALPAGLLGINDRGTLLENKMADLVVFDYDSLCDNSSYTDSHHYPSGIEYVIVNGTMVVDNGVPQKKSPGMSLFGSDYLKKNNEL